ncbi:fibropellin-1-like [Haliotis cracherodii]|uniref:fibropellin-1-like n=1 Tax=Haliotis cracherodii TaxID=6455 RepID=UPI0039E90357
MYICNKALKSLSIKVKMITILCCLLVLGFVKDASAMPKGRRFVAAYFEQPYNSGSHPNMFFVILSEVNTTVHVESGFGISEDLHIQGMVDYKYKVDESFYYQANLHVTDMSFYFTSTEEITLFCYHVLANKGEGYLALPIETLSTEYIVVTHIDNHSVTTPETSLPYTKDTQTAFVIIATEDNTQVVISLKIQGTLMAGGCGNGTFFNGESRTFTINKYQTVGAYCAEDITGTLITSDKPVAVISGHNMKYTSVVKDGMQEMLLPVKSFGRSFYLPEPPSITGGAIYRVVGSTASTSVRSPYVSGISFSLGARESHDITVDSTTGPVYLEADKPVLVVQMTLGTPSLAIVPPTSLYSSSYDIGKPVLHATVDLKKVYITVIVPTDKVLGIRPQIFPQFKVIKGSCFSEASVELISPGFYRLTHEDDVPFGAMMYVFPFVDNQCVFTHPAGLNLTNDVDKTACPASTVCSDGTPYPCSCSSGYFEYQCNDTSGGCAVDPCQYSSACTNLTNLYQCDCVTGSGGAHCEYDIVDNCVNNTCVNGICTDELDSHTCNCTDTGYSGTLCETEINECATNPCVNGTCVDHVNNYTCNCEPGYTDKNCSTEINECDSTPCMNGGTCADLLNAFECTCAGGFNGTMCEIDIDECVSNPCSSGGTCNDLANSYNCSCVPGYEGTHCESDINECLSNPCVNGSCADLLNAYNCTCDPGYEGQNCSIEINECNSMPCQNGAGCVDLLDAFECTCSNGFNGTLCEHDIDECLSNPCVNGGTCNDSINSYNCSCTPGYGGSHCETEIDECLSNPCVNGSCNDFFNAYNCTCIPGYEGQNCDIDIDECSSNPCMNGICVNQYNAFSCNCDAGFTGSFCAVDIDDCSGSPCQNNGTCFDAVNSYTCTCIDGYAGTDCLTDIDECAGTSCNHGVCVDGINMFTCQCNAGYEGSNCSTDIDDCATSPCLNDGNCTDAVNGYTCTCPDGINGTNCEIGGDPCASNPCQYNGTCTQTAAGYNCSCQAGITGVNCETDIDECASSPCTNDGTCSDQINAFECLCPSNFGGLLCELILECGCPCYLNSNLTDQDLAVKIAWLKSWLLLDKSKLSSTIRKKISVPDERPSSTGIGFSGITCLIAAFGFFLFMDGLRIVQFLTAKKVAAKDLESKKNTKSE